MKKYILFGAVVIVAIAGIVASQGFKKIRADLTGYNETPLALSTSGNGEFHARISQDQTSISYELSYSELEGNVLQSHIHLGSPSQSGGISVFLCSNLGNGPAGTQACPAPPATISGTIDASDVIGPAGQGVAAGQFDELLRAMRAGSTYVNVHSSLYPTGEIRSQIELKGENHQDHESQ